MTLLLQNPALETVKDSIPTIEQSPERQRNSTDKEFSPNTHRLRLFARDILFLTSYIILVLFAVTNLVPSLHT